MCKPASDSRRWRDLIEEGEVIADGPATSDGEISLGKNALIGFMTWEGYNYEDAVLLNERLVRDDVYTSIHIEEYEHEARDTKLGPEEITREIPNVGDDALKDLDADGYNPYRNRSSDQGISLSERLLQKEKPSLRLRKGFCVRFSAKKRERCEILRFALPHGEYRYNRRCAVHSTKENGDELASGCK